MSLTSTLPDKALAVALVDPLPADWCPRLWGWLHERPEASLDDTSPPTVEAFVDEMARRHDCGERTWGVLVDGEPAGAIGYAPITARAGMLHGVCVSRRVSGRGVADQALSTVLAQLKSDGVQKVSASYFADNAHIRACLKRLGFVDEGFLQDQTVRGRVPVSLWLVAKLLKGRS